MARQAHRVSDRRWTAARQAAVATREQHRYDVLPAVCPKCFTPPPGWRLALLMGQCLICGGTVYRGSRITAAHLRDPEPGGRPAPEEEDDHG